MAQSLPALAGSRQQPRAGGGRVLGAFGGRGRRSPPGKRRSGSPRSLQLRTCNSCRTTLTIAWWPGRGRAGGSRKTPVPSREEVFRELVAPYPSPRRSPGWVRAEGCCLPRWGVGLSGRGGWGAVTGKEQLSRRRVEHTDSGVRPENGLDGESQAVMKQLGESCLMPVPPTDARGRI